MTLKAEDGNGGSDTLAVTITLTDVDRAAGPACGPLGDRGRRQPHQPVGELDDADEHRSHHRQLRSAVPGRHERELDRRPPNPDRHQRDDPGPDREHLLPGAGAGEKRRRREPLVAVRVGADRRTGSARRADEPQRHARQPRGDAQLGRSPPAARRSRGYEYEQDVSGRWISTGSTDTTTTVTRPDQRSELTRFGCGRSIAPERARPPAPRRASPRPRCPAHRRASASRAATGRWNSVGRRLPQTAGIRSPATSTSRAAPAPGSPPAARTRTPR